MDSCGLPAFSLSLSTQPASPSSSPAFLSSYETKRKSLYLESLFFFVSRFLETIYRIENNYSTSLESSSRLELQTKRIRKQFSSCNSNYLEIISLVIVGLNAEFRVSFFFLPSLFLFPFRRGYRSKNGERREWTFTKGTHERSSSCVRHPLSEAARFPPGLVSASSSLMFTACWNGTGIKAWNKPRRPSLVSFPLYEDDSTADKTLPPFPKPVKTQELKCTWSRAANRRHL